MSRVIIGDSNVDSFWNDAISDRKEMRSSTSFIRLTRLDQVDAVLNSVSASHVVLSFITNLITDHVEAIGPMSQENLLRSVSTIITKALDEHVYPLCFRLKDYKVLVFFNLYMFLIFVFHL